ncbi:hypothetical protein HAP48_0042905 [Bradyrhizobium septentrionale]|uniref:Uncharacterized protein n=1 Tax=Bradyrhizobium septentrionale TaxID=1404411 RepID=A0A973W2P3_9BRAD|nr:hypothetical protein [Bradyrhizobium septentrionale]UGY15208.1 hypothetical protein HAP48_0042905 [Bradyrhizobium septentrionale]UGY23791.1 hypothetical protein HU675_0038570 [Bradyrhizobium septentrionale]
MTRIILKCYPASRVDGNVQIAVTSDGPHPQRTVEIVRAAEAEAEFKAYCAEVEATGKGAAVSMSLGRGERAPNGFHKLPGAKTFHPVNI